jgi:hypothetical protein
MLHNTQPPAISDNISTLWADKDSTHQTQTETKTYEALVVGRLWNGAKAAMLHAVASHHLQGIDTNNHQAVLSVVQADFPDFQTITDCQLWRIGSFSIYYICKTDDVVVAHRKDTLRDMIKDWASPESDIQYTDCMGE